MTQTIFYRRRDALADCGPQVVDYLAGKYGGHFTVLGARSESWGLPADRFWARRSEDNGDDTVDGGGNSNGDNTGNGNHGGGNDDVFAVFGSSIHGVCAFSDAYYSVLIKPAYEHFVHTLTDRLFTTCNVQLTLNRESPNPNGLTNNVPLTDIHRYIRAEGPQFCARVTLFVPALANHIDYDHAVEALRLIAAGFAKARLMAWLTLYVTADGTVADGATLPPIIAFTGKDYRARILTTNGFRTDIDGLLPSHGFLSDSDGLLPVSAVSTRPVFKEESMTTGWLQDDQLERLCALVYLDGLLWPQDKGALQVNNALQDNNTLQNNGPLSEIVDFLLAYGLEDCKINGCLPCEMTEAEWLRLLRDVRLDEDLCALRIKWVVDVTEATPVEGVLPGHRAVGFWDGRGTAYAVFRGTCGDDEWYDNALGMVQADTMQQQAAVAFVSTLAATKGVRQVVTAGHSKGGNKAQYAAIASPEGQVCYCFSLDGQGFSPAFMNKYRSIIAHRKPLIHPTAERRDFVNCLGVYLSDATVFRSGGRGTYKPDAPHGDPLPYFHCPDALRDETGELGPLAEDAPIPRMLNRLVTYFLEDPQYAAQREETALDLISLMMENKRASTDETAEALVNIITVFMDLICVDENFQMIVESVIFNETDVLLASLAALTRRPETTAGGVVDMASDTAADTAADMASDKAFCKPGSLAGRVVESLALRVIKDKKVRADLIGCIKFFVPLMKKMRSAQDQTSETETKLSTVLSRLATL